MAPTNSTTSTAGCSTASRRRCRLRAGLRRAGPEFGISEDEALRRVKRFAELAWCGGWGRSSTTRPGT